MKYFNPHRGQVRSAMLSAMQKTPVTSTKTAANIAILISVALFLTSTLHAQTAYRVDPYPVTTTPGTCLSGQKCPLLVIPGSTVAVSVTTYTDSTAGTSCPSQRPVVLAGTTACRSTVDNQGAFGFWVTSGTFTYTITLPNGGGTYGPYPVTISNTASSGGAALVGYVSPEPGSQATTVAAALARTYFVEDACGAATSGVTDQASCVATAIGIANTDHLRLACRGTTGYFAFKTNTVVTLTGTTLDMDGSNCTFKWAGSASSDITQPMLAIVGSGNAGGGPLQQLKIRNLTLGATANVGTLLRLDNIANPDVEILFAPASTVQVGLLLRAVQIGRIVPIIESGSIVTGVRTETLSGPVGGSITLSGNIGPTTASFAVSGCGSIDSSVRELVIEGEAMQVSCSAGTITVLPRCGTDGHQLCRGDEATAAASHAAGTIAQPGFPVITDDLQIIGPLNVAGTGSLWQNGGGTLNLIGGHYSGTGAVAVRNTFGFINCLGCQMGENSTTGYYQNYNVSSWGSSIAAGLTLYGALMTGSGGGVDIEAGFIHTFGGTIQTATTLGSGTLEAFFNNTDVRGAATFSGGNVQCNALPDTSIAPCNQMASHPSAPAGITPVPGQFALSAAGAASQTNPVTLMLYCFFSSQVSGGKRMPIIWWGANGGGGLEYLTGLYCGSGDPNADSTLYGGVGSLYADLGATAGHVLWVKDGSTGVHLTGWTGK